MIVQSWHVHCIVLTCTVYLHKLHHIHDSSACKLVCACACMCLCVSLCVMFLHIYINNNR